MAVYTRLSGAALRQHLRPFRIGDVTAWRGVRAGTINTIYEVRTTRGRFILRILEDRSPREAGFEAALLKHLAAHGLKVPEMVRAGRLGLVIPISPRQHLSVFRFVAGREIAVFEIRPAHLGQIGAFLGDMHRATRTFPRRRRHRFHPAAVSRILRRCLDAPLRASLRADLDELWAEVAQARWPAELPHGIVHGDLFIDNARFVADRLRTVLDFEMAGGGPWVYDLAVAICDWSFQHDQLAAERARVLVQGYEERRPLTPMERTWLYPLCRYAAARFAVTRFHDFEVHQTGERLYKDYRHFLARLRALKALTARSFRRAVCASED